MGDLISWASSAFAFAAAMLWLISAKVRIPDIRDNLDEFINDLSAQTRALRKQASLGSLGAYAASAAAFLQGVSLLLPLIAR
jgi:hypothetical protein